MFPNYPLLLGFFSHYCLRDTVRNPKTTPNPSFLPLALVGKITPFLSYISLVSNPKLPLDEPYFLLLSIDTITTADFSSKFEALLKDMRLIRKMFLY